MSKAATPDSVGVFDIGQRLASEPPLFIARTDARLLVDDRRAHWVSRATAIQVHTPVAQLLGDYGVRSWAQSSYLSSKSVAVRRVIAGEVLTVEGLHDRLYINVRSLVSIDARRGGWSATFYGSSRQDVERALGYNMYALRGHLERQFVLRMSWANRAEWHIDHRRPRASFAMRFLGCPEFKRCWGLSNLRPLWADENVTKGAIWLPSPDSTLEVAPDSQ